MSSSAASNGNELIQLQELLSIEANNTCFDCGSIGPTWASLSHGSFICLTCSGIHRGFGLQTSFVKSVTMDTWSARQLLYMKNGGNANLKSFFDEYKITELPISARYKTEGAAYYRKRLRAIVDEAPLPPPLDPSIALQLESQHSEYVQGTPAPEAPKPAPKKSGFTNRHPEPQGDVFNTIGTAFGSFVQTAYANAEKAVSDIQTSAVMDQAKGMFEMSKSWIEVKGKKFAENIQDPEWWEENHCKARIGAQKMAFQLTSVASNAQDWFNRKFTGVSGQEEQFVYRQPETQVQSTETPPPTMSAPVGGSASIWSEPKDTDDSDPIMDHFKKVAP
ncbi:ADP-ribosylation factor GTPase-activating, putative [Theileria equi strain WA]|uniref:ADP-ribosylation factor GTPase-activating, putative n=1 Tax=Theileria equi strain WA TaxID=1537102 RepID=L1LEV0_THEEQ|nr:ADP-ribosylation factor GTPase-activating, putative [Theileria equi strain WA]EKX73871.1 ADP-ribosylation factor GTPase-activating, putative [Theileria equi strain WA]|eukprot:XP_004833323.1 ADP-ribosylation factor GTPase-activating, putative [Theileria equi strain WA]